MFNFNPFNKLSSMLFSNFLTPYFTSIDENQINVGFWKGEIVMHNLELSKNFFFLNNIDLEVLYGEISELRIKIPWNSISTSPIELSINGIKLVLSNVIQRSKKQKKEMKEQLTNIKKRALQEFENSLNNRPQSKESSWIYMTNLMKNFIENAQITFKNVEITWVYQIKDFELVKFGMLIQEIEISKFKGKRDDDTIGILMKEINVKKISVFFEFYDNYSVAANKKEQSNSENKHQKLNNSNINENIPKNFIINNFDFQVDIKLDYFFSFSTEIKIKTTPILFFLKQRQLRHISRALTSILNQKSDRPPVKPGVGDGSKLWWKYSCNTIII